MEIIIKLDHDEPVKVNTSSIYGEMPQFPDMDKIKDKFWSENYIGKLKEKIDRLKMDLQNRDDEIQDLKLENDRLKQRDELMLKFNSDLFDQLSDKDSLIMRSELIRTMVNLRKQLEALG